MAATPRLNSYIPHTPFPKQAAFLMLPCREAFYGGAAGPGKSDALLMAALQYVDVPGYSALLLRRTYSDLSKPGALMDRARTWLMNTDAHWNAETHSWRFPSGAVLSFGYLEHPGDELQYQSAEYQFCGFDELSQFDELQYRYLFSRLRRLKGSNVPLRMRSASNPGGPGHDWVKARFIDAHAPDRVFVRALFTDNPYVDQAAYRQALAELDPITRQQLEEGDWDVRREGAIAKREWFPIVDAAPAQARRVRYWDLAATERSLSSRDPDWTAGVKMAMCDGVYYIEHVIRERVGPGTVESLLSQTAQTDGALVSIGVECEGGSAGKLFTAQLIRSLAGYSVYADHPASDKITRLGPFLAQARAGNVRMVRGAWNAAYIDEMCALPDSAHDDQGDGTSGAFSRLALRGQQKATSRQG
jgi:predicted phage terminase large subunit-like protein